MKRRSLVVGVMGACSLVSFGARAGGGFAGATEITQIMNNVQLIAQYEQTVMGYLRQGLQLQSQLKNLISNPLSILPADIKGVIGGMSKIMSGAQSIGATMAQIDGNFDKMFKSKIAGDFSKKFRQWHDLNTNTLQSALKAIGSTRDNYESNEAALNDLYNRSQSTGGNLEALQTLAQINVRQIQSIDSLKELMATQSSAALTHMATVNAKEENRRQEFEMMMKDDGVKIPKVETAPVRSFKSLF